MVGNDGISDFDDVYFNLIGNDWDTTIDKVNFTIKMPKDFDTNLINFTSGSYGYTGSNVEYSVDNNIIKGYTTSKLYNHESLTVRIELPDGYFVNATSNNKLFDVIFLIASILIMIISLLVFMKYGRDEDIVKTVEFYPPNNMTPAEVGYIAGDSWSDKNLTSMIIYFASKGYLKIREESEDELIFTKVKDLPKNAKLYEKCLFDNLFTSSDEVKLSSLKYEYSSALTLAKDDLQSEFSGEKSLSDRVSLKMQRIITGVICLFTFISYTYIFYQIFYSMLISLILGFASTVLIGGIYISIVYLISKMHTGTSKSKVFWIGFCLVLHVLIVGAMSFVLKSLIF